MFNSTATLRTSKISAMGAIVIMALGLTAVPSSAAPEKTDTGKSYVAKGGKELLGSNNFKKPKNGEKQNFVYDSQTGESYYLGTGTVAEFEDEAAEVFAEIGVEFSSSSDDGAQLAPSAEVSPLSVSPTGCNSITFCMVQGTPLTGAYGFYGPGTDSGYWSQIAFVDSAAYKVRWYEVNSTAAYTLAPNTATYLAYRQNIRQVQQYS